MDPLLTFDGELVTGEFVDRPNRFVIDVRFEDGTDTDTGTNAETDTATNTDTDTGKSTETDTERVFLGDPGALERTLLPGRTVLCSPVDDPTRKTAYDAIAVCVDDTYVSVRSTLANDLFDRAVAGNELPAFEGYERQRREPPLPDHGRTDFLFHDPTGAPAYVEVKSATAVEDRVAMFPDRQTERGRRHLRSLEAIQENGTEAHLVFVVQRPDVDRLVPYREVDPAFAELLARVRAAGVGVHAISTAFDPPHYVLHRRELPVDCS